MIETGIIRNKEGKKGKGISARRKKKETLIITEKNILML